MNTLAMDSAQQAIQLIAQAKTLTIKAVELMPDSIKKDYESLTTNKYWQGIENDLQGLYKDCINNAFPYIPEM